jgi:hypothetical protein
MTEAHGAASRADIPRVFIGYDPRERVAVNVLADSIQATSSVPVLIGQVRQEQLLGSTSGPTTANRARPFRSAASWCPG